MLREIQRMKKMLTELILCGRFFMTFLSFIIKNICLILANLQTFFYLILAKITEIEFFLVLF
ncbi:MAG: hypothetical protein BWY51_00100 [Parcubacteria group bacterium ADurb.Bin316]|nr:MAG: hypothetical protein BWY51_00100 [Parcubacteria group bacterium ADurb.Bin316]